jgi:hypothetical protein
LERGVGKPTDTLFWSRGPFHNLVEIEYEEDWQRHGIVSKPLANWLSYTLSPTLKKTGLRQTS